MALYYTPIRITAPKPTEADLKTFTRKVNDTLESIAMKVYGNVEYADLHSTTQTAIADVAQEVVDNTTSMTFEDVQISEADGIRVDTVLTSGETTAAVYFSAKGTQIGLYRTSDNKQLWGGKLLPDGSVVTVTSALIDPDGDGGSYFKIVTDDVDTSLTQFQNSYEGATEEENPTPVGSVPVVSIGSSNTGAFGVSSWSDLFMAWFRSKGSLEINGDQIYVAALDKDTGASKCGISFDAERDSRIRTWGHIIPTDNDTYVLGSPGLNLRYQRLYCNNAVDVSSDERIKQDIKDIDPALIMKLRPRAYRLKTNPGKLQYGLIAQEVKVALDECGIVDADLYGDENPDSLSLRYEQLIAPLIATVQRQEKRIKDLEAKLGGTA